MGQAEDPRFLKNERRPQKSIFLRKIFVKDEFLRKIICHINLS